MLEKELQKLCLSRLDIWKMHKVVIHFDDLSQFGVRYIRGHYVKRTQRGLPDIVAYVKHKDVCALCFFELKVNNNKQSEYQIEFMMKFKDLTNVWYDVITEPYQIDDRIDSITGFTDNQLKEMVI